MFLHRIAHCPIYMAQHNDLGILGEEKARIFLQNQGYEIIAFNWRYSRSEVDIIAKTGNFVVFVEVKTRSTTVFGEPEDFVSDKKQQMMISAAEIFLEQNPHLSDVEVRFDIVSIILNPFQEQINHFEDAFSDLP
jgi:putative endonuclease